MDVASDVTELVGETPLLRLDAFAPNLLGKVEAANPGGSVKDRVAVAMLERAREAGLLEPGGTVVEPTSGNTGIGLAVAAAAEGYDLVLTMPESMSEERRDLLRALGADLVLTPADGGMAEAIEAAETIADEREDSFVPQQFANLANPRVHRETTGPEIWRATDGEVDAVVAGVGTGGTITGVSAALKADRDADVRSIAVEPADSAVLSGGEPGGHSIQGIGAGFVPEVLRTELLDEVHTVESDEATAAARRLAGEQGLLVGISSGAAIAVAERIAADAPDETVVVVLPDAGERYLSTELFA
ncbi:cysteine synthase A [Haloarcula nitratireducens]|uniref:Cysteine synthase A n=1 Tax=Haloarcula nitratireducens TaxID=2487749 RepID=A0AAW4PF03_9EURY|nr:cysteine synthase A [Halomicroarcula nitratireducens]MBX0296476.1 cysteine synthase A [Halomicroarcula nitratireducens]